MLHVSIWMGNISGVENMLAAGADVNWKENHHGQTPLFTALRMNNSEIVRRLLMVKSLRVSKAEEEKMKEVTCKKCDCKDSLYDRYIKAKQELDRQDLPAASAPESRGSLSLVSRKADGKQCANPGCEKRGTHRCSRCLAVAFCSRDCSVPAWPQHRNVCKPSKKNKKNSLSEVD